MSDRHNLAAVLCWLAVVFALSGGEARAAACTDGTDCYCDCIAQNPPSPTCEGKYPGIVFETALAMCEDWEAVNLYTDDGVGDGSPNYGPWFDNTGDSARRGFNSYWTRKYGLGGASLWPNGSPASPQFGSTCTNPSGCREAEYCGPAQSAVNGVSNDCWDGNDLASIDIQRAGDYDEEVPTITGPDPFDGQQHMARRVRTTSGYNADLNGTTSFTRSTEIGYTAAFSLSNNWLSSGLMGAQWKQDEWDDGAGAANMFPVGTTSEYGTSENMPFMPFIDVNDAYEWSFDGGDNSCVTAAAAATETHGSVTCDTRYRFFPDPARYQRSTHWTDDTWHCIRGHLSGMGTSSMRMRVWYDGDTDADVIIDVTVDGTKIHDASGLSKYYFNAYSNWKQSNAISSAVYRGNDNLHIRRGPPVSCAAIGFDGAPPPAAPTRAPALKACAPGCP